MYKHLASISGVLYTAITMFSSKNSKNNLILNFGATIFLIFLHFSASGSIFYYEFLHYIIMIFLFQFLY